MKVQFSPQIIGELRHRVINHNSLLRDAGEPSLLMKLGTLKGLYKRWYGGRDPHLHALNKIDQHLAALRDGLIKAEARDPATGRFEAGGSGPPAKSQREFYGDVASRSAHRALADENAGYDAAQTQVIPETRYSTLGPLAGGAAGMAYSGYVGATATGKGSPIDQAITHGLGWSGEKVGSVLGNSAGLSIKGAAQAHRHVVGLINRHAHTTFARPAATAGAQMHRELQIRGAQAGRMAGRGVGRAQGYAMELPGLIGRRGIERLIPGARGAIIGRIGGAALSMGTIGALSAAPAGYHFMQTIGPWLDSAFPRHVRKSLEVMLDAPEVLAKRDELLNDELAKANLAVAARAALAAARGFGSKARRIVSVVRPSVASHSVGPTAKPASIMPGSVAEAAAKNKSGAKIALERGKAAGEKAYAAGETANKKPFAVNRMRGAQAYDVASHAVPLGLAGAGVGAIAGAAGVGVHDYMFAEKHPRDPHGRFATKAHGAKWGAKIGGAAGLAGGLIAGIAAARTGRTNLLSAALSNLARAHPTMRDEAALGGRELHASAWIDKHKGIRPQAPSGGVKVHEHVKTEIEKAGLEAWKNGPGKRLSLTPQKWYEQHIDDAFEADVLPSLRRLADVIQVPGAKPGTLKSIQAPLYDTGGVEITHTTAGGLAGRLDVSRLNPAQTKLWESRLKLRNDAIEELGKGFKKHAADKAVLSEALDKEIEKKNVLWDAEAAAEDRARSIDEDGTPFNTMKAWARKALGHETKATNREDLRAELGPALNRYKEHVKKDLAAADTEITKLRAQIKEAEAGLVAEPDEAVKNPFWTGKPKYFPSKPSVKDAEEAVKAAASKDFVAESDLHARAAQEHLDGLVAAQQMALQARLPNKGLATRQFERWAPKAAAAMHQASLDYAELTAARYEKLSDRQKKLRDWLATNKNPAEAYKTAAALVAAAGAKGRAGIAWGARNAKTIGWYAGVASAIGAVDYSAPPGKRIQLDPTKWHVPKGLRHEYEMPNPIDRPHEVMMGASYRAPDGQQKFLTGVYVKDEKGDFTSLPHGTNVEQVRNLIRNRSNQQNNQNNQNNQGQRIQAAKVNVKNPQILTAAIANLKSQGHINRVGPQSAQYSTRTGGSPGAAEKDWADAFYADHLEKLERFRGVSTNRPDAYFSSLKTLFEGDGAEILSQEKRANLLFGGGGYKRGIFANRNGVFTANPAQANKSAVTTETLNQIDAHKPTGGDAFRQLNRAIELTVDHYGLTDPERKRILDKVQGSYVRNTGQSPPAGPESHVAGSKVKVQEVADAATRIPVNDRAKGLENDHEIRDAAAAAYRAKIVNLRTHHGPGSGDEWTEDQIHAEAMPHALEQLTKSEDPAGLRKFLSWGAPAAPAPVAPQQPRTSRIAGAATAVHAARHGSELGGYGGGQTGWELGNMAAAAIPGAGKLARVARIGIEAVGGGGGSVIGPKIGVRAGRALGDTSGLRPETTGSTVGTLAGIGTQFAAMHYGKKTFERAGEKAVGAIGRAMPGAVKAGASKIGQAAAGVASKAIGGAAQRIGGKVGGWLGGIAGSAGGTAAEPGGGTLAGGLAGRAIGTAVGAGLGWAADEGVGYLYDHLSHYGAHVPDMAAKSMGVHSSVRRQYAQNTAARLQPATS